MLESVARIILGAWTIACQIYRVRRNRSSRRALLLSSLLTPCGIRQLIEKAMRLARRGNHVAAIKCLREALVKCPGDSPYLHNMLGFEFLATNQLLEARNSYEEAVRLMPHDSPNHANYALSLAATGDLDSAEKEVRRAIELDKGNTKAKSILELLLRHKRPKSAALQPSK